MYQSENGRRPAKNALTWEEKNQGVFFSSDPDEIGSLMAEKEKVKQYLRSYNSTLASKIQRKR